MPIWLKELKMIILIQIQISWTDHSINVIIMTCIKESSFSIQTVLGQIFKNGENIMYHLLFQYYIKTNILYCVFLLNALFILNYYSDCILLIMYTFNYVHLFKWYFLQQFKQDINSVIWHLHISDIHHKISTKVLFNMFRWIFNDG